MRKFFLALISLYRKISFIFPATCKFIPTCSEYAYLAFKKYPTYKAIFLVIFRILRCNPFSKGGFDPVR